MSTKVTQDDLLDALRSALTRPADGEGTTVPELARATGRGEATVRDHLRRIMEEGRLEVVSLRRPSLNGVVMTVRGYRIKPAVKLVKGKRSA